MKANNKTFVIVAITFLLAIHTFINVGFAQSETGKKYSVIEELEVMVPMRDGTRLSTNIYRPDAEGEFPVILVRSPYGSGGVGNKNGHFYAPKGYVYISQDARGRYSSEGQFYAFRDDASDGFDTQQWIAEQSWSNGKIGTAGGSYNGFTQWMSAKLNSPSLVTMMPVDTWFDSYSTMHQNGAFFLGVFSYWSVMMTQPFIVSTEEMEQKKDSILLTLPIINHDSVHGWRVGFYRDLLLHPTRDSFWDPSTVSDEDFSKINASVFNVGGWYDIFLKGTIDSYVKMTGDNIDPEIRKKQRLMIGPWKHDWGKRKYGDLDYGEDARVKKKAIELRWMDSQLKGIKNGVIDEPPVKIFTMGINKWRFENEWPLARTNYTKYYFHSGGRANTLNGDGVLSSNLSSTAAVDTFTYDPQNPVIAKIMMGPNDQTYIEERNDVLVYTTEVLDADVEVTGPVTVKLFASSSETNTDFTAKLVDVHPDGKAIRICDGIIRASYRESNIEPSNIEPGKIYEYSIDLWATSNVFLKGHKIRVEISSSNLPRFDRNLNTGEYSAMSKKTKKALQMIYHSKEYPSHILLPIIEE